MALKRKSAGKRKAWNKGIEVGKKRCLHVGSSEADSRSSRGSRCPPRLKDLALFSTANDTMLRGPELLNLTVKDVQLPSGRIRAVIKVARPRRKPAVLCALSAKTAK